MTDRQLYQMVLDDKSKEIERLRKLVADLKGTLRAICETDLVPLEFRKAAKAALEKE